MKAKSRRQFTSEFKVKVVLEVLRQEKTLNQIASDFDRSDFHNLCESRRIVFHISALDERLSIPGEPPGRRSGFPFVIVLDFAATGRPALL
ncbi:transposase [Persicitalea jodogahamensis]|uniref:transposase n=1 Tax=Persicitalea jodogahamensis TaxID=402147 RepID=UPI00167B9915|nr:transposase [Persicitalea jodogahamensis]